MSLFFTVTKKGLAVALAIALTVFLTVAWGSSIKATSPDGSTAEKRMLYITELNLSVDGDNATYKETVIPEEFGAVYSDYNRLQRKGGFDLSQYKGKAVTVYTYPVIGQNKNLTLIVHKGKIIGGDIADIALNGSMEPIERK